MGKQHVQEAKTVEQIMKEISRLDLSTQLSIAQRLLSKLKSKIKTNSGNKNTLLELEGLGAEIWQDESVEEYIRKEREWIKGEGLKVKVGG